MNRRASSELLVSLTLCLLWFSPVSSAQNINTVAGGGHAGGTSKSAFIAYPGGTVRDKAGNTYISSNWGHYVFKLDTKGNVSVVAGKGWAGFGGDGGPATRALLNVPGGLALDSAGNLYIGDSGNNRIRRVEYLSARYRNSTTLSSVRSCFPKLLSSAAFQTLLSSLCKTSRMKRAVGPS